MSKGQRMKFTQAELDRMKMLDRAAEQRRCEHEFIPDDNEGCYGHSVCRFCGVREHN